MTQWARKATNLSGASDGIQDELVSVAEQAKDLADKLKTAKVQPMVAKAVPPAAGA